MLISRTPRPLFYLAALLSGASGCALAGAAAGEEESAQSEAPYRDASALRDGGSEARTDSEGSSTSKENPESSEATGGSTKGGGGSLGIQDGSSSPTKPTQTAGTPSENVEDGTSPPDKPEPVPSGGDGSPCASTDCSENTTEVDNPLVSPVDGPAAGNEERAEVPLEAVPEDTSSPDQVVGDGTPQSCTSSAVVEAVAQGGVITFNCGPEVMTIEMEETAKVFNNQPDIVLDGGGLVTLSGMGQRRILYMNTCDERQVWTTSHCNNQEHPQLVVQNLTFINGNAKSEEEPEGGAIFASGGRFKVVNSRFFSNVCADTGPDVGGGALRVFQQYEDLPVFVVNSTFGGAEGLGNICSNGGALSSIGVSWTVINSVLSYNEAIGNGGNPKQDGTPGGGSGGAIYNDGNTMTLRILGSRIEYNRVNAYGSAIFFVTNDHTGNVEIQDSTITDNIGGSWYPTYPQISNHDDTPISVTHSVIE